MTFDRWQAPDRDTPTVLEFSAEVSLGTQLDAIMQAEGLQGTKEEVVKAASGVALSRPRRWHKLFERMGLLYQDAEGNTQLTDLGKAFRQAKSAGARSFRRQYAQLAIQVLRKYQLLNPADITDKESYPADTDCHPYWVIWKAAVELDGKLHWDELNRELMWVLRHSEVDAVIAKIKKARTFPDYDPVKGGAKDLPLRDRAYDQTSTTDDRDPAGQVRDQKTTPWFKRAGLGELLLTSPGKTGNGYWSIPPDILDLLVAETAKPPTFSQFEDEAAWYSYYGSVDANGLNLDIFGNNMNSNDSSDQEVIDETPLSKDLPDTDEVLAQVVDIIREGGGGVLLSGPPGTSKSWYARQIAGRLVDGDPKRARFVQFHPSMGYDDFVEGYVPVILSGTTSFAIKRKVFLRLCEHAEKVAPELCVLVIDELNRGDTGRIFGELLTYIEPSYRDKSFNLAYSGKTAKIPKNLFFIGTFNPFDKSVVELDDAMDRRFDRIPLEPSATLLNKLLKANGAPEALIAKIIPYFVTLNKSSRHGIGHALFMSIKDDQSLKKVWNRKLKFILEKSFRFEPDSFSVAKQGYLTLFDNPENAGI
ncbi:McrB family protein [Undibacterium sp. Ji67W]|uniref:McrB family protein n=1 Tax=Undibacterium sp. Ji67W TaxID=3413042 RepID=UPI003BF1DD4E